MRGLLRGGNLLVKHCTSILGLSCWSNQSGTAGSSFPASSASSQTMTRPSRTSATLLSGHDCVQATVDLPISFNSARGVTCDQVDKILPSATCLIWCAPWATDPENGPKAHCDTDTVSISAKPPKGAARDGHPHPGRQGLWFPISATGYILLLLLKRIRPLISDKWFLHWYCAKIINSSVTRHTRFFECISELETAVESAAGCSMHCHIILSPLHWSPPPSSSPSPSRHTLPLYTLIYISFMVPPNINNFACSCGNPLWSKSQQKEVHLQGVLHTCKCLKLHIY